MVLEGKGVGVRLMVVVVALGELRGKVAQPLRKVEAAHTEAVRAAMV